jgi:hypothetical protein
MLHEWRMLDAAVLPMHSHGPEIWYACPLMVRYIWWPCLQKMGGGGTRTQKRNYSVWFAFGFPSHPSWQDCNPYCWHFKKSFEFLCTPPPSRSRFFATSCWTLKILIIIGTRVDGSIVSDSDQWIDVLLHAVASKNQTQSKYSVLPPGAMEWQLRLNAIPIFHAHPTITGLKVIRTLNWVVTSIRSFFSSVALIIHVDDMFHWIWHHFKTRMNNPNSL